MSFLQPIWLWGLLSLVVPILIHLWNRHEGKVLKVGSIQLLQPSSLQSATRLRLKEIFLLIIRCLLLALLSFLLAKPVWKSDATKQSGKWLIVPQENLSSALNLFGSEIDSLMANGFVLKNVDTSFTSYEISDSTKKFSSAINKGWDILQALNNKNIDTAIIFSVARLKDFVGNRPKTNFKYQWHLLPGNEQSILHKAVMIGADSLLLQKNFTNDSLSYFTDEIIAISSTAINTTADSGRLHVSLKEENSKPISAGEPIRIVVVEGKSKTDANYLMAALKAIQNYASHPITVEEKSEKESITDADWVFWLSDEVVPETSSLVKIFRYNTGELQNKSTVFSHSNSIWADDNADVFLSTKDSTGEKIWAAGNGSAPLTKNGNEYIFNSRFLPSANSLVWSKQFPALLMELILPDHIPQNDHRQMNVEQLATTKTVSQNNSKAEPIRKDMRYTLGFILLGVVAFERILSHQNKPMA